MSEELTKDIKNSPKKKPIKRKSQRGLEDKILYNKYNRGAEIIRDDSHIKPTLDPVVHDYYRESVTDDIISDREWADMCDFIHKEYLKTDIYKLEEEDPKKLRDIMEGSRRCVEELQEFYRNLKKKFLREYPDTTEKEFLYIVCETLQLSYKKVWDSVLTPVEKQDILSTLKIKEKVSKEVQGDQLF